ncbi:esterase/lipase family protein [Saccharothrix syringae]|uniref:Alpha/beta hydrolase n=1 Tax=Saccharothrix syringae TaxID=103733 RepID=A0A5Q0GWI7_SACSY|nr:alpha/beta hydrolase [Saccharothrix syringae]QFZ18301.1 alpha/beta hydrolase [Saccharothrix syringae]
MVGRPTRVVALAALLLTTHTAAAGAAGGGFAPVHREGPALSVPAERLDASLTCTGNLRGATGEPVLLLAGTGVNSDQYFGWNWKHALTRAGIPWCASDVPGPASANENFADIQVRAEYVVHAIRTMRAVAGRRIGVLGHSQGGLVPRWALRFWPDVRPMVDDVVALAPTSHGTPLGTLMCPAMCPAAVWQQRTDANFVRAVDSHRQTFRGISYTVLSSHADPLVPPASADLTGPGWVANVRLQDACPADTADHDGVGTTDPVAEALALDALAHRGPADPARLDPAVCSRELMSGADPATHAADSAWMKQVRDLNYGQAPRLEREPELACYTTISGCPRAREGDG